jgi:hypothetical protein
VARGKTESEAEELVDTVDRDRREYIRKYFHMEWPNLPLYHAMFNTAVGDETVVQAILDLMKIYDAQADARVAVR